jgi:hypothetical protein
MNRILLALCAIILCGSLTSCAVPKNQASIMNGKVRGGSVPLYVMGYSLDFIQAGILKPSNNDYLRTYYDVMDVSATGQVSPSYGVKSKKSAPVVAQVAIPSLFSSFDLPSGYEAKYALPTQEDSHVFNLASSKKNRQPQQIYTDASLWASLNYQVADATAHSMGQTLYPRAVIAEPYPRALIVES